MKQPDTKLDFSALTVGGIAPRYVALEVAAQLMGVSHWTVRRWISAGHQLARKRRIEAYCKTAASAVGDPLHGDPLRWRSQIETVAPTSMTGCSSSTAD